MLENGNNANIYENWIASTPIILQRKFQVKQIPDEPYNYSNTLVKL